jgi:type IV secretory pathway VirB2 component (pilin)
MKLENLTKNVKEQYLKACQSVGAFKIAPSTAQTQIVLFAAGMTLLVVGLADHSVAQSFGNTELRAHSATYNDQRVAESVATIMTMIEGSFGALVMVTAGIAAILSSAFGQYRAALGCLVVAVGSFILRSLMKTFFNTESIDEISEDA